MKTLCHGGMCVDVDRILGKSWWPDVCVISRRGHTWVKSPERVRLTGGRACWRERGHSYRSISSYRKLPPPACPGTTCSNVSNVKKYILYIYIYLFNFVSAFHLRRKSKWPGQTIRDEAPTSWAGRLTNGSRSVKKTLSTLGLLLVCQRVKLIGSSARRIHIQYVSDWCRSLANQLCPRVSKIKI